ncbi:MAG: 2-oxoadipate dioxygenase/decarboxylase family protein [bacterium]
MSAVQEFYDPNSIRILFTSAMSEMYRKEVPLYQNLLETVTEVNEETLNSKDFIADEILDLSRIEGEKHGAIRLGSKDELYNMRRLFAVMGMQAVGYYDLSIADLPVHSTVFRPVLREDLNKSPFRVFTSLLRLELLPEDIRNKVEEILSKRQIFTSKCLNLIDIHEQKGGLSEAEAKDFIVEALKTFRWHNQATVEKDFYKELLCINSLIADIVSFKGPHINHLTPRVLDIDLLYARMQEKNIQMTPTIQGPPRRKIPILLRQTSFRALSEEILFPHQDGKGVQGTHRARFGEIETRGAALTKAGMELYDELLNETLSQAKQDDKNYQEILEKSFSKFPDTINELFDENLVHFNFSVNENFSNQKTATKKDFKEFNLQKLIQEEIIKITPMTYEDFLPVSAAGIFKSNIVEGGFTKAEANLQLSNQNDIEAALGTKIIDPQVIYQEESIKSLKQSLEKLGISA